MPAKGQYKPGTDRDRVLTWLRAHPGMHSCRTIADAVFPDAPNNLHKTAIACRALWERGDANRAQGRSQKPSRIMGLYGAIPTPETVPADR